MLRSGIGEPGGDRAGRQLQRLPLLTDTSSQQARQQGALRLASKYHWTGLAQLQAPSSLWCARSLAARGPPLPHPLVQGCRLQGPAHMCKGVKGSVTPPPSGVLLLIPAYRPSLLLSEEWYEKRCMPYAMRHMYPLWQSAIISSFSHAFADPLC